MWRSGGAVVAGFVGWWIAALFGGLVLRGLWPAYAAAEANMSFTLAIQLARLALGAASTIVAGIIAGRIATVGGQSPIWLGVLLLVFFLPVHYQLWDSFPIWYHLAFLLSLVPLTMAGAKLVTKAALGRDQHDR